MQYRVTVQWHDDETPTLDVTLNHHSSVVELVRASLDQAALITIRPVSPAV